MMRDLRGMLHGWACHRFCHVLCVRSRWDAIEADDEIIVGGAKEPAGGRHDGLV